MKCNMLTIKAMVKKDGMRVDRKYNVKLSFTYKRKVKRAQRIFPVGRCRLIKNKVWRVCT